LEQALAALREDFAASLPDRQTALSAAWDALDQNEWNPEDLNAAYHLVHSLAGAAETFGFSDLGVAARALNGHLHGIVSSPQQSPEARGEAARLYQDLATALTAAQAGR
jgi:chemotaxis protein histidine kinase CheA